VIDDTQGVKLYTDLSELWAKAGMLTHKWVSNSFKVLESIPSEHRAFEICLDSQEVSLVKTLGILWSATEDVFTLSVVKKNLCLLKEISSRRLLCYLIH